MEFFVILLTDHLSQNVHVSLPLEL